LRSKVTLKGHSSWSTLPFSFEPGTSSADWSYTTRQSWLYITSDRETSFSIFSRWFHWITFSRATSERIRLFAFHDSSSSLRHKLGFRVTWNFSAVSSIKQLPSQCKLSRIRVSDRISQKFIAVNSDFVKVVFVSLLFCPSFLLLLLLLLLLFFLLLFFLFTTIPQVLPVGSLRLHGGDEDGFSQHVACRQPHPHSLPRLPLVCRVLLPHLVRRGFSKPVGLPATCR